MLSACAFVFFFRSNFLGTLFTVYDNGISPHRGRAMRDGSNVRQELAAVHYVSVWCECVCVLYYVVKGIYMYTYMHSAVSGIVLSLDVKHSLKNQNKVPETFHSARKSHLLEKQTFQFYNKASKFVVKLHQIHTYTKNCSK